MSFHLPHPTHAELCRSAILARAAGDNTMQLAYEYLQEIDTYYVDAHEPGAWFAQFSCSAEAVFDFLVWVDDTHDAWIGPDGKDR
jgi:hypothetical protein